MNVKKMGGVESCFLKNPPRTFQKLSVLKHQFLGSRTNLEKRKRKAKMDERVREGEAKGMTVQYRDEDDIFLYMDNSEQLRRETDEIRRAWGLPVPPR